MPPSSEIVKDLHQRRMLLIEQGHSSLTECLQTSLRTTKDQRMNIMGTLVGVNRFQVHDVTDHMIFVSYAITTVHVTCYSSDIQCLTT